jgi:hypothetical protein
MRDAARRWSWHVDTQRETPEQQTSDLLFPQEDGSFLPVRIFLEEGVRHRRA